MVRTKAFQVGLVLAGAISAGAYTAGVIDFARRPGFIKQSWPVRWFDRRWNKPTVD
jgi:hypothetical protein